MEREKQACLAIARVGAVAGCGSRERSTMIGQSDWGKFRALLRTLWNDPASRRRIEQRAGIVPRTVTRWISGETEWPDRKRLILLLEALPQRRDELLAAITEAIPDFEVPLIDSSTMLLEDLPGSFWVRLLETNASTPHNLHFAGVVNLICLQLQATIDPERIGVSLSLAQCLPPTSPALPVRSLREVFKMKTYESPLSSSGDPLLLGAESLCGYSVSLCKTAIVQDTDEEQQVPVRSSRGERSAAAYPIGRGGYVAGAFLASSPRPDYFTERLQYLLQIYSTMFSLAFETEAFYAPGRLRLRPMPEDQVQHALIAGFGRRVMSIQNRDHALSRAQAEAAAWQQIEEELLALGQYRDEEREL
jgi:transcriptional regulator with XRE-family HTH domain